MTPTKRSAIVRFFYTKIIKPVLFKFDPEDVHDSISMVGRFLGSNAITRGATGLMLDYKNSALEQSLLGIKFKNPIGLAAGFDKDAHLTKVLPAVGFGFEEVGSITGQPCRGNARPRLWRLKEQQSMRVYYGLKNDGCEAISARLTNENFKFPIGTSIAKTNNQETVDRQKGIADYVKAFKAFINIGDYFTINISCPNAFGGQPFTDAVSFDLLMTEIDKVETKKPVFVKFSPDLLQIEVDALLEVAAKHRIHGFVLANLTKKFGGTGGLSGKVQEPLANELIKYVYNKTSGKYIIIGVGGVFSAEDAYKKIKLGASLIQLITGMIYQGPQLIGEINRGLTELLKKDGFRNISEAVGKDNL
jgi:dihydroorotate dehydrogenase